MSTGTGTWLKKVSDTNCAILCASFAELLRTMQPYATAYKRCVMYGSSTLLNLFMTSIKVAIRVVRRLTNAFVVASRSTLSDDDKNQINTVAACSAEAVSKGTVSFKSYTQSTNLFTMCASSRWYL